MKKKTVVTPKSYFVTFCCKSKSAAEKLFASVPVTQRSSVYSKNIKTFQRREYNSA